MPKTMTFTIDDIERVRQILKNAPEKPKLPPPITAKDMVLSIKQEIYDLQSRGYTLDEIAEMIRSGFNLEQLGASTIKYYLNKKRNANKVKSTPKAIAKTSKPKTTMRAPQRSLDSIRADA